MKKPVNRKTVEARKLLITLSQQAKEEAETILLTTGECLRINEVLVMKYKAESGCAFFRTFNDWKKSGYTVKKGSIAFRVWGKPTKVKATSEIQMDSEGEALNKEYKFWPMACLFNETQVDIVNIEEAA